MISYCWDILISQSLAHMLHLYAGVSRIITFEQPETRPKPEALSSVGRLRATEWDKGGDEKASNFSSLGRDRRKHGEEWFEAGFDQPKIARGVLRPASFQFLHRGG